MSASAPTPNKLLLYGALGIGAYYLMMRRAVAGQPMATTGQLVPGSDPMGAAFAAFGKLFGQGGPTTNLMGTADGRSAAPWSPTIMGGNNPSAFVAGGLDGLSVNVPNVSPFDAFFYRGTSGSGD